MKHRYFTFYFPAFIVILFLFSSCGSKRDIVYFQNADKISEELLSLSQKDFKTVIMPHDNLFITVAAANLQSVEVFNSTQFNRTANYSASTLDILGYLVDQKGNINFPLVGEIRVAGLTKSEATQLLRKEISTFVTDPVVNIRFLNYKISVIGEVNRPGVYTVTDEKISIPQAIALAGDLTIYGDRRNVQLIRMENNKKQILTFDLTTSDVFLSPDYYLLQNDILYIAPNSTKAGSSTYNQNLPLIVSLISVTITAIALFVRNR